VLDPGSLRVDVFRLDLPPTNRETVDSEFEYFLLQSSIYEFVQLLTIDTQPSRETGSYSAS